MRRQISAVLKFLGTQILPLLLSLGAVPAAHGAADTFQFRAVWGGFARNTQVGTVASLRVTDATFLIRTDELTRIQTRTGDEVTLDQIPSGAFVEVQAEFDPDGMLAATIVVDDPETVNTVGVVQAVFGNHFVISDREFVIEDEEVANSAPLEVGQVVAVQGHMVQGGVILTSQLESTSYFKIVGKISDKKDGDQTITVSGKTIFVTDKTKIRGSDESQKLTFADLKVGQTVDVRGRTKNGKSEAHEIRILDKNSKVEIRGTIVAFDKTSLTVKSDGADLKISLDSNTDIRGTLMVNARANVTASVQSDGSLLATRVVVKGDEAHEGHVEGKIEKIDGTSLFVKGVKVTTDEKTQIKFRGKSLKFSDLKVGDEVEVSGPRQSDGSILAKVIEVETK